MKESIDFKKTLFRASAIGQIMTEPQSKAHKEAGRLGKTAKSYCRQLYREMMYEREKEIYSKYLEKGLQVEEDAITLYSRVKKVLFLKNTERLTNEFVSGHPDLYIGKDIRHADEVNDIKSSWDLFTFPFPSDPLNDDYDWQLQTYMALTGAKTSKLIYCLIDTPEVLINDEKRKLLWKMGVTTDLNPDYQAACVEIDKNMRFTDIPMKDRICEFIINRDDEKIERIYQRVRRCRYYLEELYESYHGTLPPAEPSKSIDTKKIVLQKINA